MDRCTHYPQHVRHRKQHRPNTIEQEQDQAVRKVFVSDTSTRLMDFTHSE